jgi:asparagine synthase (glutamine-hydrolysing)
VSAICAIVALDGPPPTQADVEALTKPLERRGPDGTSYFIAEQIALGHNLLATTPEALVEIMPYIDSTSGCVITADARLDNRDALIAELHLIATAEIRVIGDGALIVAAYLRWGDECPMHLLGDFAFAIWDPHQARLFAARDQIGMRQLIYYNGAPGQLVIATEANAIVAGTGGKVALNPDRVGDYLGNMESADLESTFFEGIFRLPPAHSLRFDVEGLHLSQYWWPIVEPTLSLCSDQAYEAAFLELFTNSVRSRLRTAGGLGAMLSGGVDSNAVVAVASRLASEAGHGRLETFSAISPDPDATRETKAIRAAIRVQDVIATTVDCSDLGIVHAQLVIATAESLEPFDADMALIRAIYIAARNAGTKVLLDGGGGDTLLSSDYHHANLLQAGRWRDVMDDAKSEHLASGRLAPLWRTLAAAAWQAWAPASWRALRFWHGRFAANRSFIARARVVAPYLDLNRALRRRKHVQERDLENDRSALHDRIGTVLHPNVIVARERYDRVAGSLGIEPRDPFLDLRLICFCLRLPREQLQRHGWSKWILRQAMARSLPDDVLWRRGRQHHGRSFSNSILDDLDKLQTGGDHKPIDSKNVSSVNLLYLKQWFRAMRVYGWTFNAQSIGSLSNDRG